MTKQEEIQQFTERWLSVFAGLVNSGRDYSVDVQARLLLNKLNSKGVVIKTGIGEIVADSPCTIEVPIVESLTEVEK